ncbi:hypothetical protein [Parachryseolinea silvisoli]|uniref:hypothetical protein n=1 Tax=Parachryseolinea silvisoli TaxID=2873601 RepID=UPI0022659158|nr:hypothetical protein [Parachryseolinea silvisoli]MCD9014236.1 hypothetical protein [Parachryseolinea silvisoli]
MIQRFLFLLVLQVPLIIANAKNHSCLIREENFKGVKYNFGISKFIDARLDPSKPIGYIRRGYGKEYVINDTLEHHLNSFLHSRPDIFNSNSKFVVVINQVSLRYMVLGSRQEPQTVTIALDYYSVNNGVCSLVYQQYVSWTENMAAVFSAAKGINMTFSEALKRGFEQFDLEVGKVGQISKWDVPSDSLFSRKTAKRLQVLDWTNAKDGIYFSPKDLYLNNPAHLTRWEMPSRDSLFIRCAEIKSPDYKIDQAFAIVKDKAIYILDGKDEANNDIYLRAYCDDQRKLYFNSLGRPISNGDVVKKAVVGVGAPMAFGGIVGGVVNHAVNTSANKSAKIYRVDLDLATFEYSYADDEKK